MYTEKYSTGARSTYISIQILFFLSNEEMSVRVRAERGKGDSIKREHVSLCQQIRRLKWLQRNHLLSLSVNSPSLRSALGRRYSEGTPKWQIQHTKAPQQPIAAEQEFLLSSPNHASTLMKRVKQEGERRKPPSQKRQLTEIASCDRIDSSAHSSQQEGFRFQRRLKKET